MAVKKIASLCKGRDVETCNYRNQYWRMTCEFHEDGTVEINKTWGGNAWTPVVPVVSPDKTMEEDDQVLLMTLLGDIRATDNAPTASEAHDANLFYQYGIWTYGVYEEYSALEHREGYEEPWTTRIATINSYGEEKMEGESATELMALANKYCTWDLLRRSDAE